MIFNFSESTAVAKDEYVVEGAVSPYAVGIEGALMHVYENECNYNLIMKAAGLSELKYYQETGKDLFLTESGKFQKLVDTVVAWIQEAAKKVVAIWNKLIDAVKRFIGGNKEFVKQYKDKLFEKVDEIKDFSVKGHKVNIIALGSKPVNVAEVDTANKEEVAKAIDKAAAEILGVEGVTAEKFLEEARKAIIGEEVDVVINKEQINDDLTKIMNEKAHLDAIKISKNNILAELNKSIKATKNLAKASDKGASAEFKGSIEITKALANLYTKALGVEVEAVKLNAREAKVRCIKTLAWKAPEEKKEEEKKEEVKAESYAASIEDLFKGVVIR